MGKDATVKESEDFTGLGPPSSPSDSGGAPRGLGDGDGEMAGTFKPTEELLASSFSKGEALGGSSPPAGPGIPGGLFGGSGSKPLQAPASPAHGSATLPSDDDAADAATASSSRENKVGRGKIGKDAAEKKKGKDKPKMELVSEDIRLPDPYAGSARQASSRLALGAEDKEDGQAFTRRQIPVPLGKEADCQRLVLKAGAPHDLGRGFYQDHCEQYQTYKTLLLGFLFFLTGGLLGLAFAAKTVEEKTELFFYDAWGYLMAILGAVSALAVGILYKMFRNNAAMLVYPFGFLSGLLWGLAFSAMADETAADLDAHLQDCCFFVKWKFYCQVGACFIIVGIVLLSFQGADNAARKDFREKMLLYNFEITDQEAAWPQIFINSVPGSSSDEGMRKATRIEYGDTMSFWALVVRGILHGAFFFHGWNHLPQEELNDFLNFWRRIITYAEMLVFVMCWSGFLLLCASVSIGKKGNQHVTQRVDKITWMAWTLRGAASFSVFRLLGWIDPVGSWLESIAQRAVNSRLGGKRSTLSFAFGPLDKHNKNQACLYSFVFTGIFLLSRAGYTSFGLMALYVKMQQVDFVNKEEFGFLEVVLLCSLASQLAAIHDVEFEKYRSLSKALEDSTDKETVNTASSGTHGTRMAAWRKALCKQVVQETKSNFSGLVHACAFDTDRLQKLLMGSRSIQEQDRVISNGFGAVPWGYQGEVVTLDPFPWVQWEGLTIPREVEVEAQKDEAKINGRYLLCEDGHGRGKRKHKDEEPKEPVSHRLPLYKKADGDHLLTPALVCSMGNQLLPSFEGWAVSNKEGTKLLQWQVPTEYSPEVFEFRVRVKPITESGQEQLVWFTALSHVSLLWSSSCGSFVTW